MKKNYVSNSEESTQLFENKILDSLSRVHFSVPLFIYIPVISWLCYKAFTSGVTTGIFFMCFVAGLFVWTITEYFIHRFVFHYHPTSDLGKKIHFICHGVHHDYPRDRKRLVMPPSASIPLALLFYGIFSLFIPHAYLVAFFPGFLTGYIVYDMLHYAMHHTNFKNPIFKQLRQHHMVHHYDEPTKGFGVSTTLWDIVLRSGFTRTFKKVARPFLRKSSNSRKNEAAI